MIPKVVLDTNVLLQAIPQSGRYHQILVELVKKRFELVVSSEIIYEYQEILVNLGSKSAWSSFHRLLRLFHKERILFVVEPSYRWQVISIDQDDNKFVDAAVCGNADFVITEDRHFRELMNSDLVNVKPLSPRGFMILLNLLDLNQQVQEF